MADLIVTDDLKARFSQFGKIATITAELRKYGDEITADNKIAAGTDDSVAKAYHMQVDKPTTNLSDLTNVISHLFDTTDQNGQASSAGFDNSEQTSSDSANLWH